MHGLDLKELPEAAYALTELSSLLAPHNSLRCTSESLYISISPKLAQLSALTILDLGWNQLKVVPPAIFELPLLQSLILNNNLLESVDPRIGQLGKTLKTLHLGVNMLKSLPEEMGQLTALTSLIAPSNRLSQLPDSMSRLISLDDIYLRYNEFTQLPKVLYTLPKLSIISIEDNRIAHLPETSDLPKAQILHSVPQEVLPNLYIGSSSTSKNQRSLQAFGITHHVALTDPIGDTKAPECVISPSVFQERLLLQLSDVEAQNLDDAIIQCNAFLEKALQQGHRVLVNSTLGVSRSAAIICAYMIKHLRLSYDEALTKVKTVRGNVKPNAGFERQLRAYEISIHRP